MLSIYLALMGKMTISVWLEHKVYQEKWYKIRFKKKVEPKCLGH